MSNGVKIHYSVQGHGEPVILIHGWLSSGWMNWELTGVARDLAKDHLVVWLDLPGHGGSDKPTFDDAYGPELAAHVERLMNRLKIQRAHLVGYSMGGIVAAYFTVKHPARVISLTLGGMGWLREGSLEQKVFAAGGGDGKPVGLCFRSLAKLALTEAQVKSIRAPVQILFGADDGLKWGYVEPLRKLRPDWVVVDIPNANHLTCLIKPQFREQLRKWIEEKRKRS
jgi:pimeloyl-ACP methyl ester carboxylesterase